MIVRGTGSATRRRVGDGVAAIGVATLFAAAACGSPYAHESEQTTMTTVDAASSTIAPTTAVQIEPQGPPQSATTTALAMGSIPAGDASIPPGIYRIPKSAWSVADFTATFPAGWTVQYGHVYASNKDADDEFGFYAVVVDAIYADPCVGSNSGELIDVGPSVDDLAAALLQQPGPIASGPAETNLGGYPAIRIDLAVPQDLDLDACNMSGIGLQIWYSAPANKYFVLLGDAIASVYILDVDGERQVFMTQHASSTSDEDLAELQAVLDSIRIES
jgi:hypothetical protein